MDATAWNKRYAEKDLIWSAEPNQLFASLIENLNPGRALDVGCGEGRNAIWLAEQGWQVDAVDFSSTAINKARQIAYRRNVAVNFRHEDICTTIVRKNYYDLVAVVFLHTSIEERVDWLTKVACGVANNGRFIYIGHDPLNIKKGVGGPQDVALLPECDEICNYLNGFDILQSEVHRRKIKVETEPGHSRAGDGTALDALVFAKQSRFDKVDVPD